MQPDFESLLQPDFESLLQLDFAQLDFAQQPESFAQHDTTKNKLNMMKNSSYLLNTSRGKIVDQQALKIAFLLLGHKYVSA